MAKLSSHLLAKHKATLQWSGRSISPLLSIHFNQHRDYGLSQFLPKKKFIGKKIVKKMFVGKKVLKMKFMEKNEKNYQKKKFIKKKSGKKMKSVRFTPY